MRKRNCFEAISTFMIKVAFKKKFKFMSMCLRSIFLSLRVFLFLCVLFASIHFSSSSFKSHALRQKDALRFWSFRKLMSSRATRATWWTTMMTKNRTWMTTIVRIVFDVVVYQLIVVVSRVLSATNVLNKKSRVSRYVLNSCINIFLFNSSQISIRFRIVVYQLSDVRVALRVDEISTKTFIKKRAILQFFLIVWDRERNDWKNVDEIDKKMIRIHEKKFFFMRNIANSLRIFVKRKILEMHDLNLNFEKK
jgi:hypothetical protein